MQRTTPTTLFQITFDNEIAYSDSIPAHCKEVVKVPINELETKIARQRNLLTFTWTESIHFPPGTTDINTFVNTESCYLYYPVNHIDYSKFVLCNMGSLGLGLFANQFIAKNDFLFLYSGQYQLLNTKVRCIDPSRYVASLDHTGDITGAIDAKIMGGLAAFMQHAPLVAESQNSVECATQNISQDIISYRGVRYPGIFAARNINKGEQILMDYTDAGYWKNCEVGPKYFDLQGNVLPEETYPELKRKLATCNPNKAKKIELQFEQDPKIDNDYITSIFILHAMLKSKNIPGIYIGLLLVKKTVLFDNLSDDQLKLIHKIREDLASFFLLTPSELCRNLRGRISKLNEDDIKHALANPESAIYHLDIVFKERLGLHNPVDLTHIDIQAYAQKNYAAGLNAFKNTFFDSAVAQWQLAKKVYKRTNQTTNLVSCYWNLGNAYLKQKKYSEAEAKLNKGKKLAATLLSNSNIKTPAEFEARIETFRQPKV